ncbi:hypothetical protein BGW36DRAFT_354703 [Talaromyces proteolyticus]|uniref:BZIP domain-containing protein n=1 Tax=Talaromyces proteolyticus TaxID=1131652 RepID=A0AAD4L0J2_9EURO|nr:uncharacterized protein BGW36DRAFT_354703 [Talaromyces proteolyticus]KAH8703275.1 hypothetical protein BGW36DRAFT_354703 [Talaromyces proteolyticus]
MAMADPDADLVLSASAGVSSIPLVRMRQQDGIRMPQDDWTGVTNRESRRKLQNRLNQRAYRARKTNGVRKAPKQRDSSVSLKSAIDSLSPSLPNIKKEAVQEETDDGQTATYCHTPPAYRIAQRRFEATVYKSYLQGSPQLEHLINLSRLNVHRAIQDNIIAIGMTPSWMCDDDSISIFNLAVPGFSEDNIPASLRPTSIQRKIPHHPWLDFFPFPRMRDNLIIAGDTFDDEKLCHDLNAFWDSRSTATSLLVWGQPWDPMNWEITEFFIRKWGWSLKGCAELLASTNRWRRRRGEEPLIYSRVLELD